MSPRATGKLLDWWKAFGSGWDGFYGIFCRAAFGFVEAMGDALLWHPCQTGTNRALAKKGANREFTNRRLGLFKMRLLCFMKRTHALMCNVDSFFSLIERQWFHIHTTYGDKSQEKRVASSPQSRLCIRIPSEKLYHVVWVSKAMYDLLNSSVGRFYMPNNPYGLQRNGTFSSPSLSLMVQDSLNGNWFSRSIASKLYMPTISNLDPAEHTDVRDTFLVPRPHFLINLEAVPLPHGHRSLLSVNADQPPPLRQQPASLVHAQPLEPDRGGARVEDDVVVLHPLRGGADQLARDARAPKLLEDRQPAELHVGLLAVVERGPAVRAEGEVGRRVRAQGLGRGQGFDGFGRPVRGVVGGQGRGLRVGGDEGWRGRDRVACVGELAVHVDAAVFWVRRVGEWHEADGSDW